MSLHRRGLLISIFGISSFLAVAAFARPKDITPELPGSDWPWQGEVGNAPVSVSLLPIGPSVLALGDLIRLQATTNQDGFGHFYISNTSGKITLLAENLPMRANRAVELPRRDLLLRAAPPAGDNTVLFVATRDRLPGFGGGSTVVTPGDIQVTESGLVDRLTARLKDMPRTRWGYTTLVVSITE
jgi:hypothetical protein